MLAYHQLYTQLRWGPSLNNTTGCESWGWGLLQDGGKSSPLTQIRGCHHFCDYTHITWHIISFSVCTHTQLVSVINYESAHTCRKYVTGAVSSGSQHSSKPPPQIKMAVCPCMLTVTTPPSSEVSTSCVPVRSPCMVQGGQSGSYLHVGIVICPTSPSNISGSQPSRWPPSKCQNSYMCLFYQSCKNQVKISDPLSS